MPPYQSPLSQNGRRSLVAALSFARKSSTYLSRDATSISAHPVFCGGISSNNQGSIQQEPSVGSGLRLRIDRRLGLGRERATATSATNNLPSRERVCDPLTTGTEQTPKGKRQQTPATSQTYSHPGSRGDPVPYRDPAYHGLREEERSRAPARIFSLSIPPGRGRSQAQSFISIVPVVQKPVYTPDLAAKKAEGTFLFQAESRLLKQREGETLEETKKGGRRIFLDLSKTSCAHKIPFLPTSQSGVYVFCAVLILSCFAVSPCRHFVSFFWFLWHVLRRARILNGEAEDIKWWRSGCCSLLRVLRTTMCISAANTNRVILTALPPDRRSKHFFGLSTP